MLDLNSPRWGDLTHAYGKASDVPALLLQLATLPPCDLEQEPWASLWGALAHQGDVYPASFAAVPHVVAALATNPLKADSAYFQFPAWVECCRARNNVVIPDDLVAPYRQALTRLPQLVADASKRPWDEEFMQCALAAIATAKGATVVAEAAMELDSVTAGQFLEWFHSR